MKILLDTNVILDVLMDRQPFVEPAEALFAAVERGVVTGYVCGTTITTVHYLATKKVGTEKAQLEIGRLLQLFEVAPVNRLVLCAALAAGWSDYEDAVIVEAAVHAGLDVLVTRDPKGFKKSPIRVSTCSELVMRLGL